MPTPPHILDLSDQARRAAAEMSRLGDALKELGDRIAHSKGAEQEILLAEFGRMQAQLGEITERYEEHSRRLFDALGEYVDLNATPDGKET